jgi:hypothetical protein
MYGQYDDLTMMIQKLLGSSIAADAPTPIDDLSADTHAYSLLVMPARTACKNRAP